MSNKKIKRTCVCGQHNPQRKEVCKCGESLVVRKLRPHKKGVRPGRNPRRKSFRRQR